MFVDRVISLGLSLHLCFFFFDFCYVHNVRVTKESFICQHPAVFILELLLHFIYMIFTLAASATANYESEQADDRQGEQVVQSFKRKSTCTSMQDQSESSLFYSSAPLQGQQGNLVYHRFDLLWASIFCTDTIYIVTEFVVLFCGRKWYV